MSSYIDIHCHVLPGVDDGSQSLEESVAMLRALAAAGVGAVIVTPHQKPERRCVSTAGIRRGLARLQAELDRLHIEIRLYPGSELFYSHALCAQLEEGSVCTLAGSHYVLVEFLPDEGWEYIRSGLYELLRTGKWPVIAHAERYIALAKNLGRVEELIDMGCYIQVNAGSICGRYGLGQKRAARALLKEDLVHFVATDAHRETGKRGICLEECRSYLNRKYGRPYAQRLLCENGAHILRDTELE